MPCGTRFWCEIPISDIARETVLSLTVIPLCSSAIPTRGASPDLHRTKTFSALTGILYSVIYRNLAGRFSVSSVRKLHRSTAGGYRFNVAIRIKNCTIQPFTFEFGYGIMKMKWRGLASAIPDMEGRCIGGRIFPKDGIQDSRKF